MEDFPEARKPLYRVTVDFGPEVGIRKSGDGDMALLIPEKEVPLGSKIF